jgi:putative Ca2+/H+ antiporter (TMEM165/GDT1 family)
MRPKAASMIKFGIIFLIVDLIRAGIFRALHDRMRTVMFLGGCVVWIIGLLIWINVKEQEDQ